jgi:hypothetical protein
VLLYNPPLLKKADIKAKKLRQIYMFWILQFNMVRMQKLKILVHRAFKSPFDNALPSRFPSPITDFLKTG